MGCEVKERIRETITPRANTYPVEQVQSWLLTLVGQLRESITQFAALVPRQAEGYTLKTKVEAPEPRWEHNGTRLKFKVRVLVETEVGPFSPDVIEVKLEGKKIELRVAPGQDGQPDTVSSVEIDLELKFKARDEAMPAVTSQLSELAGQQIATCTAIRTHLQQMVRTYVEQLRDAAARGARDLRTALSR